LMRLYEGEMGKGKEKWKRPSLYYTA
jgi:hypothetical protein